MEFLTILVLQVDNKSIVFLSNLYAQCGTQTHYLEIKSHMVYELSQSGASKSTTFQKQTKKSNTENNKNKKTVTDTLRDN